MKILYKVENLENGKKFVLDSQAQFLISKYEGDFGKLDRWIPLDKATQFELSREYDRKTVIDEPEYLKEELDENGNSTGNTVLVPAQTHIEIRVPDDFTITEEDITAQYEEELDKKKLEWKYDRCRKVLIHINYVIRNFTKADKITLMGRSDVALAFGFLEKGSLVDTKTIIDILPTDSLLTQEMRDNVSEFIGKQIEEYNQITWE